MQLKKSQKVTLISALVLGPVVFLVLSTMLVGLHRLLPMVGAAKFSPMLITIFGIIAGFISGRFCMTTKGNESHTVSRALSIVTPFWLMLYAPIVPMFLGQKLTANDIVSWLIYVTFLSVCSGVTSHFTVLAYKQIET